MARKVEPQTKSKPTRRRRLGFRLAAVAVGLLPFVVLEVALRAFDVERPTGYTDPFVGFSKLHPQFEKDEEKGIYETTHSRQLFFGRQEFAIEKPANGVRIFCLGGSTVRGRPYTVETAFARWMQIELAATDPRHSYEVVNCGGLSYASYRLAAMLKELLRYEPDAIVLATGHNEFLEDRTFQEIKEQSQSRRWLSEKLHSLRTVTAARRLFDGWRGKSEKPSARQQLEDRLQTRLDEKSGYASYHRDEESRTWRKNVVAHYEAALRGMATMCEEAGVPLVLVRLGSNLRDCPPIKSEPSPDLGADGARKSKAFDAFLETATRSFEAKQSLDRGELELLLKIYKQAEAIDGEHALLCYRMARVYDRLGEHDKAAKYYIKAKDNDVCPLRMLESMSDIIVDVAEDTDTPLVDARKLLEERSPQGIPGSDFYLDHVHPTIGGHQLIARALVERMRKENILAAPKIEWTASDRRRAYEKHVDGLEENFYGKGMTRVGWLEGWAHRERMEQETRPNDLRGYLHDAHRMADLGADQRAWQEYALTLARNPEQARPLLERVLDLFQQGRTASAEFLLGRLLSTLKGKALIEAGFAAAVISQETDDEKTVEEFVGKYGKDFSKVPADSKWRTAYPESTAKLLKKAKTT